VPEIVVDAASTSFGDKTRFIGWPLVRGAAAIEGHEIQFFRGGIAAIKKFRGDSRFMLGPAKPDSSAGTGLRATDVHAGKSGR
jgi:hypothetical protein